MAAAFFGTNYLAHRTLIPPYMHRSHGEALFEIDANDEELARLQGEEIGRALAAAFELGGRALSGGARLEARELAGEQLWNVVDVAEGRGEKYRLRPSGREDRRPRLGRLVRLRL